MAFSAIVKNIYTFANILSQAGTDVVANWDEKSLQNALNWAAYCTKIAQQSKHSSFRAELDTQIQSFTILLKPASLLYLTLDSLCSAKEILCKRLRQNPQTPDDILRKIDQEKFCDGFSNHLQSPKGSSHSSVGQFDRQLLLLLGEDPEVDQWSVTDISSCIQNRLLHLERLSHISENRFITFLKHIVQKIADCTQGLEVLGHLLLCDIECENEHTAVEKLKENVLKIVLQISGDNSGIWTANIKLLCEMSARDDLFLEHHMDFIVSWLNNMEPVYGLTDQGDLYTWRHVSCSNDRMSYKALTEHVATFADFSKRLQSKLVPRLENLANKSYFNICRDLLKCL